jgi:diguanylate cyclase (GGDEF)-like protein
MLYRAFTKADPPVARASLWANRFVLGAAAMGCVWGVLGSLLLPPDESVYQLVVIFVIGGVTASAMIVLSPLRWAFPAFMLPALVPLVVVIFMQTTSVHPLVGAMLVVFMGVMLATLPVVHGTHVATLRARFETNDALTGLPNRAMFNERLAQALARAERYRKQLAVLFIDLDRFKIINDTLGHAAGDVLLTQLAAQLRGCLREGDTIGRQGGDEFVVLIEDVSDPQHTSSVAKKILETVAQPYILGGQTVHVTASVGASLYPDDGSDQQTLLKNADIAMYRAKEQGKNNLQYYSAQLNQHTLERLELETSLRGAVERQEFLLHYAPKIDMRSGRITGVEALIRWMHPELGMVAPGRFMPLAEETGLIGPIGEWALRTACNEAAGWIRQGASPISVAVNLSARQLARDDLAQSITAVLRESGLEPRYLELEITESTVMHDAGRAATALRELKALGIRIAIDDFGTGYSSLGNLKRFPIDRVKIDHSFILDLPHDEDDVAITRAVIAMAHSLGLQVIAEGVETGEQADFLREHHCDEMQGYFFSPPVDSNALMRLVAEDRVWV